MASNYMQFSEAIDNLTEEEARWIDAKLNEIDDPDTDSDTLEQWQQEIAQTGWLGCEWEIVEPKGENSRYLWLYSEESGNCEFVAYFVQAFLAKFRPTGYFTLEWATWCSKPRIREFSGGALFITATAIEWLTPEPWFETMKAKHATSLNVTEPSNLFL